MQCSFFLFFAKWNWLMINLVPDVRQAACLISFDAGCGLFETDSLAMVDPGRYLDLVYLQRMRTADDRRHVVDLYADVFGRLPPINVYPDVAVNPSVFRIGNAAVPRRAGLEGANVLGGDSTSGSVLQVQRGVLLRGMLNATENVAACIRSGWMCLVIGPPASGKTSVVRSLAALTGNVLHEYALTSATDTTELLGCFEQYDPLRSLRETDGRVMAALERVCAQLLSSGGMNTATGESGMARESLEGRIAAVKSLYDSQKAYKRALVLQWGDSASLAVGVERLQFEEGSLGQKRTIECMILDLLSELVGKIRQVMEAWEGMQLSVELEPAKLEREVTELRLRQGNSGAGRFQWVDGILLKALERGEWVLLENANFCNPTVLDRLNPLLEPGGNILVNERGLINGEPMLVQAHPNFRLFLTLDSRHGEVSRAMRNRGVEIFLLPPDWLPQLLMEHEPVNAETLPDVQTLDLKAALGAAGGIPGSKLLDMMCRSHREVQMLVLPSHGKSVVSLRDMTRWACLLVELLERGISLAFGLVASWEQVYVRRLDSLDSRDLVREILTKQMSAFGGEERNESCSWLETGLVYPGGWPCPLRLESFVMDSSISTIRRDGAYFYFLLHQHMAAELELRAQGIVSRLTDGLQSLLPNSQVKPALPLQLMKLYLGVDWDVSDKDWIGGNGLRQEGRRASKMLFIAGLCFLEKSSSDFPLRVLWLKFLQMCFCGLNSSAMSLLSRLLNMVGGELDRLGRSALAVLQSQFCELAKLAQELIPSLPYDLSTDASIRNRALDFLEALQIPPPPATSSEGSTLVERVVQIWKCLTDQADKLAAIRKCTYQSEIEMGMLELVQQPGHSMSETLLGQSYWHYTRPASRGRMTLAHRAVAWFYPLFVSLRRIEELILQSEGRSFTWAEISKAVTSLHEWREALWGVVDNIAKQHDQSRTRWWNWEPFLVTWQSVKSALQMSLMVMSKAEDHMELSKERERILHLVEMVDKAFGISGVGTSSLLWKRGGHPQVPSTLELFQEDVELSKLCQKLRVSTGSDFSGQSAVAVNEEIRRLATQGLCMLRWVGQKEMPLAAEFPRLEAQNSLQQRGEGVTIAEAMEIRQLLESQVALFKKNVYRSGGPSTLIAGVQPQLAGEMKAARYTFPPQLLQWPGAQVLWLQLLPLLDHASLVHDALLLFELSPLVEAFGAKSGEAIKDVPADRLEQAMSFSLKCMSRSPADFVPHQQLLWIADAPNRDAVITGVGDALQGILHEMWFRWQVSLWDNALESVPGISCDEKTSASSAHLPFVPPATSSSALSLCGMPELDGGVIAATTGPPRLFLGTRTTFTTGLITSVVHAGMKDHYSRLLQLRLAAQHFWDMAAEIPVDLPQIDWHNASVLFIQGTSPEPGMLQKLAEVLGRSSHRQFGSLIQPLLLPCAQALVHAISCRTSNERMLSQAKAWALLGALRFHLLLPPDGCDPAGKYAYKRDHLLDRLEDIQIEIEVRASVQRFSTGSSYSPAIERLWSDAANLRKELQQLEGKIVPRPKPSQFMALYEDLCQFLGRVMSDSKLFGLISELEEYMMNAELGHSDRNGTNVRQLQKVMQEAFTWQDNAMHMIQRLSSEYPLYRDVVQPFQLSVYLVKYGLSLMVSTCIGTQVGRVLAVPSEAASELTTEGSVQPLADLLSTLMEFPVNRADSHLFEKVTQIERTATNSVNAEMTRSTWGEDMLLSSGLVKKTTYKVLQLIAKRALLEGRWDLQESLMEVNIALLRVALLRASEEILHRKFVGGTSLQFIEWVFDTFVSMWNDMRERQLEKEREEAELFKTKATTHTLETQEEEDEESFKAMFPNHFEDYEDLNQPAMVSAEEDDAKAKAFEKSEKERMISDAQGPAKGSELRVYGMLEGTLLRDVIRVHSLVFSNQWEPFEEEVGVGDKHGVAGDKKIELFELSYNTGCKLLQVMDWYAPADVDTKTQSAHLLRVCIEHQRLGKAPPPSTAQTLATFDIRKDANIPELALMLEPLSALWDRLMVLLEEWPEHPILLQLVRIIERVLSLSETAPIMKALVGLELLLEKAQLWEENAAKHVSLAAELDVIARLIQRWRKLELASWPGLLNSVGQKHREHAEKMWFVLYGLLHRPLSENVEADIMDTTASVEEFIQTAAYGEFERRMEMVHAFYGQLQCHIRLGATIPGVTIEASSRLCCVLYHIHRYYMQFMPAFQEVLKAEKAPIEQELKDFARLAKWEDRNYFSMAASADKAHRKLHKFVRKYEVCESRKVDFRSASLCLLAQMAEEWRRFCCRHLELQSGKTSLDLSTVGQSFRLEEDKLYQNRLPSLAPKMAALIESAVLSTSAMAARREGASTLEELAEAVVVRANALRTMEKQRAVKKKALVDLLKMLRQIGLSHHKSAIPEGERSAKSWFQQPTPAVAASLAIFRDVIYQDKAEQIGHMAMAVSTARHTWQKADDYYYKNMARMQRMWQCALEFNKDLSLREVEVSARYVEHLLHLQRVQRRNADAFAEKVAHIVCTSQIISLLGKETENEDNMVLPFQSFTRTWMWRAKSYTDRLVSTASEAIVLLETVNSVGIDTSLDPGRPSASRSTRSGDKAPKAASTTSSAAHRFLSRMLGLLNTCKEELDGFLAPGRGCAGTYGLEAFSAGERRPRSEIWPPLIIPSMHSAILRVFGALKQVHSELGDGELSEILHMASVTTTHGDGEVGEVRGEVNGLQADQGDVELPRHRRIPGWENVHKMLCEGLSLAEEFASATARGTSVKPPVTSAEERATMFSHQFERTVQEMLITVQTWNRASAEFCHADKDDRTSTVEHPQQVGKEIAEQPAGEWLTVCAGTAPGEAEEKEKGCEESKDGQQQTEEERWSAGLEVEGTLDEWAKCITQQMAVVRLESIMESLEKTILLAAEVADACVNKSVDDNPSVTKEGVQSECDTQEVAFRRVPAVLLTQLHGPLRMLCSAAVHVFTDYIEFHKAVAKLGYVLSNLFCSLYKEGFCSSEEEEADGEGASKFEEASGTGMGEGEGKKDVSDEIEDEEQLLGDNENLEEEAAEGEKEKNKNKGVEMEQDFEGKLFDLSDDEEDEEEEEGEENKDERMDQQMGETGDKEEVVDEKLWGNEDEEEERKRGEEKYEKDAPVSGVDEEELEYRGREEEEEEGRGQGEEKDRKQKEKEKRGRDTEGREDGSEEEEEEEEEAEEGVDDAERVGEDQVEQKHGVKPEEDEELQLPDNMELDGEMQNEEDKGEDGEGKEQESKPDGDGEADEGQQMKHEENMDGDQDGDGKEEGVEKDEAQGHSEGEEEETADDMEERQNDDGRTGAAMDEEEEEKKDDEGGEAPLALGVEEAAKEDGGEDVDGEEEVEGKGDQRDEKGVEERVMGVRDWKKGADQVAQEGAEEEDHQQRGDHEEETGHEKKDTVMAEAEGGKQRASSTAGSQPPPRSSRKMKREKPEANPHRSLGDALREWKERLKVVGDALEQQNRNEDADAGDEGEGEEEEEAKGTDTLKDADYEYVAGEEKGEGQTVGPATEEQIMAQKEGEKEKEDTEMKQDDEHKAEEDAEQAKEEEEEEEQEEGLPVIKVKHDRDRKSKKQAGLQDQQGNDEDDERRNGKDTAREDAAEDMDWSEGEGAVGDGERQVENFVSIGRMKLGLEEEEGGAGEIDEEKRLDGTMSEEEMKQLRDEMEKRMQELRMEGAEGEEGKAKRLAKARTLWRRYEHMTSRLAQELSEQLRLILEPTLATKLQGDYRSGKRINMKKVIPYIASQFRKDKIWLRRTKPNKRQYQVVLAIDDSKSMSESRCGHLALEAMATICKAMSHLDIGQMAVVNFGSKGNVHLLHSFDQSFSDEAGVNIVSQFSFNQDNTIADEPAVDLLHFLARMLDAATLRSSATNGLPIQQLVLVIADGRFHEKESLRRCVRELTSRRQLLAFLVLDNPQESIIDMQTVSFAQGKPSFSKYLDSFPFPYYILLQDIVALPRTLADLLRQWFELMQRTS
ncbi:hypothetical protein CBR_g741 [Chara braunii]|uniref:VWFA domain-containing protein n=1 Tax=Chara braunii TaxID=69332 RepID=A0A388KC53_CHABU|nr:hypothetical protein CBR_g741 [Chara braunii]|eukprot:GBG67611.1 hypothetical protein CBR_g741 [Chara braunii]